MPFYIRSTFYIYVFSCSCLLIISFSFPSGIAQAAQRPRVHTPLIREFPLRLAQSRPTTILVGPDGNLWFTEPGSYRLGRLTPTGQLTEFPLSDPTLTNGIQPQNLLVGPDGNLWFTTRNPDFTTSIGRITPQGTITLFSAPVASPLTPGPNGTLWFTMPIQDTSHTNNGNQLAQITTQGIVTVFPVQATGNLVPASDGTLWFIEHSAQLASGNKIASITPKGIIQKFCISETISTNLVEGPDGNLWFGTLNSKIWRITPHGTISNFATSNTPTNSNPTGPIPITQLVSDPHGFLWFTEQEQNMIGRITKKGQVQKFTFRDDPHAIPHLLLLDAQGTLWSATWNYSIKRITSNGALSSFSLAPQNGELQTLLIGPDGSLWFTTDQTGNTLFSYSPSQGTLTSYNTLSQGTISNLIEGPDNTLWFTESDTDQIGRISFPA